MVMPVTLDSITDIAAGGLVGSIPIVIVALPFFWSFFALFRLISTLVLKRGTLEIEDSFLVGGSASRQSLS